MYAETRFRYIKVLFHIVYYVYTEVMNIVCEPSDAKVLYIKDLALS